MKKLIVKTTTEIKFLKISCEAGVLQYSINNPKKNNGCVSEFLPLPLLIELKKIIDAQIKIKIKKVSDEKIN